MLTETAIKAAKQTGKPYKLSDERGMYLLVTSEGGKYWRFDYRFAGKRKTLALGVYPDVPLKAARQRRDEARTDVASGIDPANKRKAEKLAHDNTLEAVTREWFGKFKGQWKPSHADLVMRRLEQNLFPYLGERPIETITPAELLKVLRRVEGRQAIDTTHRVLQYCGRIFRYAVATSRASRDITADLRGAIPPPQTKNFASITEPEKIGQLLRAIYGYEGTHVTVSALKLSPLVFLRPGELRHGEWSEIDFSAKEWRIPAPRMKMGEPHIVPLSKQAIAVLRTLQPWTGQGKYLFPGARSGQRPISDNTVNAALRRIGYGHDEMTGHGFRAMARTVLDEVLGQRVDWIEHQLAHAVKDPNGRAYNRTAHLPQRHKMMQTWADYLDKLRAGDHSAEESG
jgi:integrase